MSTMPSTNWHEANQRYLMAALAVVREALERHVAQAQESNGGDQGQSVTVQHKLLELQEALPAPSALDTLCSAFALSPFERGVLLLCAGMELDSAFAQLCAVQGNPQRSLPTFSLALAALPEAHWSALTPAAPLRRWRLIEVGSGDTLTTSPLRIDERVLHYLTGVSYLDTRLHGLVESVQPPKTLPASHHELAQRIVDLWSKPKESSVWSAIQLCGDESAGKRAVAAHACAALGLQLYAIHAADIPLASAEREALARLWEREVLLSHAALFLDYDNPDNTRAVLSFLDDVQGLVYVASHEPLRLRQRSALRLEVHKPSVGEQRSLWQEALGPLAAQLNGQVETLVSQFSLGASAIDTACAEVLSSLPTPNPQSPIPSSQPLTQLWAACRIQARQGLDDLAQRIEPAVGWDDLVVPAPQLQTLHDIVAHVQQRAKVYETWGFASKGSRGLGMSALFAGASGTGKTMAAEVLANELQLDLYRIDLSQVVSKYIGETEKNLRRVFDAAEEGGAVLLFDEADALFGKRSEVKDSHDRHANIEVSYLLQRMEAYRGLAILTTNMKSALDTAFLRRLRFVVQFPFPDTIQRFEIWRRVFPTNTPTEGLDMDKLARLNVAGGNIRNIALHAAFLAAEAGQSVRMTHLLHAARSEYAKLEKPLTENESRGWV